MPLFNYQLHLLRAMKAEFANNRRTLCEMILERIDNKQ